MKLFLYSFCILALPLGILAQDMGLPAASGDMVLAKKYVTDLMYGPALEELKLFYKKKPDDEKVNELLATCYLNLNEDKSKAIKHLEFLYNKNKINSTLLFDMGRAYHLHNEFDKSLEFFNRYKQNVKGKELELVEHEIECVQTAKEMVKFPVSVSFANLGKEINSEYPELMPFVNADESIIYYTSKRKGTTGNMVSFEGYESDVFFSDLKNNDKWNKGKSLGATVNTMLPEDLTSVSSEGNYMVYSTLDELGTQVIKTCYKAPKGRAFEKAQTPPLPMNDAKTFQWAGTVSSDGQVLIFSSDRPGGYGSYDLYICQKLPNGMWGEPINMGSKINTKYDDNYPNFGIDQNMLYFASMGHSNMGGFDVFKTQFSHETHAWNKPTNLGYPVNTTDNDYSISFNKTGRHGYLSRTRVEGWGNSDIYQLTFNNVDPSYSVISVKLSAYSSYEKEMQVCDSLIALFSTNLSKLKDPVAIDTLKHRIEMLHSKKETLNPKTENSITVQDLTKKKLYGEYIANAKSGKFMLLLEPGMYELSIVNPKYNSNKTKITIYDKSNFVPEKEMNIVLHKGELDVVTPPVKAK